RWRPLPEPSTTARRVRPRIVLVRAGTDQRRARTAEQGLVVTLEILRTGVPGFLLVREIVLPRVRTEPLVIQAEQVTVPIGFGIAVHDELPLRAPPKRIPCAYCPTPGTARTAAAS